MRRPASRAAGRWASVWLLLLASPASAAPAPGALRRTLERILERPAFAPAFWGIEVRSLKTGRVLFARNAEKNFRPASTLKLVTTAAVLDALGPDARLRTTVETTGRLDGQGRILGDLFLVGRGDPSLSGPPGAPGGTSSRRSWSWRTRSRPPGSGGSKVGWSATKGRSRATGAGPTGDGRT